MVGYTDVMFGVDVVGFMRIKAVTADDSNPVSCSGFWGLDIGGCLYGGMGG